MSRPPQPARSRRRRVTLAAIAATLTLAGAGTASAADPGSGSSAGDRQAIAATHVMAPRGGLEPIELKPYQPLDIAEDTQLGLLPEGKQNYVISSPGHFADAVERAKDQVGDAVRYRAPEAVAHVRRSRLTFD